MIPHGVNDFSIKINQNKEYHNKKRFLMYRLFILINQYEMIEEISILKNRNGIGVEFCRWCSELCQRGNVKSE